MSATFLDHITNCNDDTKMILWRKQHGDDDDFDWLQHAVLWDPYIHSVINGVAGDQDNDENMGDSDSNSGKVSLYSVYSVQEDS